MENKQVLLLQDTPWTPADLAAFQKAANKRQYNLYWQPGHSNGSRRTGGLTTLVSKQLCQQPMTVPTTEHTHTYVLAVHVQGVVILNCYGPPGEQQNLAERLVEVAVANKLHQHPWLSAGDFNEEPNGNGSMATTILQLGGTCATTNCSTHWEGRRELDWFATNKLQWCSKPWVMTDKALSDHKAIALQLSTPQSMPSRCRYKPQPRWHKPVYLDDAEWNQILSAAWTSVVQHQQNADLVALKEDIEVDKEWTNFMTLLSDTYKKATADAIPLAPTVEEASVVSKTLKQPGHAYGKGVHEPKIQRFNNTILTASHSSASMAERKIAKRLARLHEFNRLAKRPSEIMTCIISEKATLNFGPWQISCGQTKSQVTPLWDTSSEQYKLKYHQNKPTDGVLMMTNKNKDWTSGAKE
eukprot:s1007_g30.t1